MTRWLRWTLAIFAPIVGIFASLMTREWRDDILNAFPFVLGHGPISLRAVAFWALVSVPVISAFWTLYATHRDKKNEDRRREQINTTHARAVLLSLSWDNDELGLWASNQRTHLVRDLQVNAIPDNEDWQETQHGPLPHILPSDVPGVTVKYPILGGWFVAKVEQLSPGRGLQIVKSTIRNDDYTRIDFDVLWNDHEGRQRKSHGATDLGARENGVTLQPRPSPE